MLLDFLIRELLLLSLFIRFQFLCRRRDAVGEVGIKTGFINIVEICEKLVVLFGRQWIVLMVMASRALQR